MLLVGPPSKKDSDPEKLKKPSENQRDWNGSPTNFSSLPQTDFDWDQLIAAIQLGSVIPVVGKDLLQIEMLGRAMKVDSYLAGELARAFGFTPEELPFSPDLADVICSKPELCAKLVKNAQAIYSKVASVYETKIKKNPNFPVPCALQKLAEIPRFSFFLSLTCDDLLHQALESARGQPPVRIDNERKGTPDITEEQLKSGRPVVYRLFGRFAHWGDYALTEEDMLEFMHWLPERAYRPEKLFNYIQGHNLLLLGTALPDWMSCFFLRATRSDRLRKGSNFTQYVVDRHVSSNARLSAFLQNFGTDLTIYSQGDPCTFVDELHRRWMESGYTDGGGAEKKQSGAAPDVLLSYANEDRAAVLNAKTRLEARDLTVWLDQAKGTAHRLSAGAEYDQQIRDRINQCGVFVPLISSIMVSVEDRYFRKEWSWATERMLDFFGTSRAFIIPVLIDDTPRETLQIPREFRSRDIKHAPDGMLTDEICDDIENEVNVVRSLRKGPNGNR